MILFPLKNSFHISTVNPGKMLLKTSLMFFHKVKLSGDGAALTHNSGLVVFSFSLLDDGQAVMSSSGNIFMCTFGCTSREGNAIYY